MTDNSASPPPSNRTDQRQRRYWDGNLDTRNLSDGPSGEPGGRSDPVATLDLDEEIAFLSSPEYVYARERIGDPDGLVVIDIGCGLGVNALALARDGARVIALDLSLERLRAVRRWAEREGLAGRVLAVQGVVEDLPFLDGSLDRAFTKSVLIHTRLDAAADDLARVLCEGGRGVFIEPARANPFVALYRRLFAPGVWREIAVYFDAGRWRRFARPFATFEKEPFFLFGFLAFYWQFRRRDLARFRAVLRPLGVLDAVLFRLLPPLRRLAWMDVAVVDCSHGERDLSAAHPGAAHPGASASDENR